MKNNQSLFERAKAFMLAHHRRKMLHRVITVMAVLVVFVTTYMLVLPAITMVRGELICGKEEHVHKSDCYTTKYAFTCGLDEADGHEHTDDCLTAISVLTCEKPEHYHDDSCYAQKDDSAPASQPTAAGDDEELIFEDYVEQETFPEDAFGENGLNTSALSDDDGQMVLESESETEPVYYCGLEEHAHTEDCFAENGDLLCTIPAHVHTKNCLVKQTELETETETETESETETASEIVTEAETEAAAETENATEAASEVKTEAETEPQTQKAPANNAWGGFGGAGIEEPGIEAETGRTFVQNPDGTLQEVGQSEIETEAASENETETESNTVNIEETESESESESESEGMSETEEVSETESESETETAAADSYMGVDPGLGFEDNGELSNGIEPETEETETNSETGAQYICGLAEHTHMDACYDEEDNLICGLEEHVHSDLCVGVMTMADDGTNGSTTISPTDNLATYLDSVTGSGTVVEENGNYSSNLRFDFSMTPGEIAAEGYDLSMDFPDGIIVPDGLLGKEYKGYDTNNKLAFTYNFEKVGDNKYKVNVKFNESYVQEAAEGTDIRCYISFWGELNRSQQDENGKFDFKFGQEAELTIPLKDITYTENENFHYDITVRKDGSYVSEDNELVYNVVVSSQKGTPDTVTVKDVLSHEGFSVKDLKVTVRYPDGYEEQHLFTDDNFTLNLPKLKENEHYEISYAYSLQDGLSGNFNANNSVSVESGTKDTGDFVIDKAEKSVHISRSVLSKAGEYKDGKIYWTITVNPKGEEDITGATVTDLKFPEHTIEELGLTITPSEGVEIQTDENGIITGLHFTEWQGGSNKQKYVITYTTDVSSSWSSTTETNTATYTKGEQSVSDSAGVNVPGTGDVQKEFKNATKPDENGCVEVLWKTTIKIPDANASAMVLQDWIGDDNTDQSREKQWMTKEQIGQMLKDNAWLKEDYLRFSFPYEGDKPYSQLAPGEKISLFLINFSEEFCKDHAGEELELEYSTTCYVGDVVDDTRTFNNTLNNSFNMWRRATYTYDNRVKVRKMDGNGNTGNSKVEIDIKTGELKWKVRVILDSDIDDNITIVDDLPDDVRLKSIEVGGMYNPTGLTETGKTGDITNYSVNNWDNMRATATYDPSRTDGEIKLTVDRVDPAQKWPDYLKAGAELWISYTCELSDELKKKIEGLAPGEEMTVGPFTNKVSVKIDNSELPYGEDTQTQEGHVEREELKRLFKSGSWDNTSKELSYSLDINREGDSLIPNTGDSETDILTVTDTLTYKEAFQAYDSTTGANVDVHMNVELIQDSVKLYYAQRDASGNILKDSSGNLIPDLKREVPPDVWNWKYTKEGTAATIEAKVPDSEAMVLMYDYKVTTDAGLNIEVRLGHNTNINNIAKIEGSTSAEYNAGYHDVWVDDGTGAGAYAGRSYTFYKVDTSNYGKSLSGAEFTLYKYNLSTNTYDKTEQIYTTQNGKFSIFWQRAEYPDDYQFEKNTLYYVVETKAPEHYKLPAESSKFYFHFSDSGSEISNYPEGYESLNAVDLSLSSYTEYCDNTKEDYTYDFEKVDSEDPSVKLGGAEFTVFEYQVDRGTYVKTDNVYTTNEEGKFSISWNETYKKNTAYYAVETKAPTGYAEPTSEAEKYYFYFSNEEEETSAYPEDFPQTAKDLSKKDGYSRVENTLLPGLVVEKQWFGGDGQQNTNEEKPKSVQIQLYKKSTDPSEEDQAVKLPVVLNDANGWRYEWHRLEEGDYYVVEMNAPSGFTVSYKSIKNGVESEEKTVASEVTAKSGETIVVSNKESGTDIEVEKVWVGDNEGKSNVEVQLYKSTVAPNSGTQTPVEPPTADEITIGVRIGNWVDSNGTSTSEPQNAGNLWVKVVKCDQGGYSASENAYNNGIKTGELSSSNGWSFTTNVPKDGYYILQFGTHGNEQIDTVCVPDVDGNYAVQKDLQVPQEGRIYTATAKLKSSTSTTPTPSEPTAGKKVTVKIVGGNYNEEYEPALAEGFVTGDTAEVRILFNVYEAAGVESNFMGNELTCNGLNIVGANPLVTTTADNTRCYLAYYVSGLSMYDGDCILSFDGKGMWPKKMDENSVIDTNPVSPVSANFSMPITNNLGTPIANTQILPIGAEPVDDSVILGSGQSGEGYTSNGWGYQWKDLPRANESGQKLYYYVVETENGGSASTSYEYDYEKNSAGEIVKVNKVTITNTPPTEEEKVNVTVEKKWLDKKGETKTDGLPEGIDVKLHGANSGEQGSVTLNASNEWKHTWSDLPKDTYWVEEVNPGSNYKVTYSIGTEEGSETASTVTTAGNETITITNQDDGTEIEVEKVWADGKENHTGDSVTMELYSSTIPPETEKQTESGSEPTEQDKVKRTVTLHVVEWEPSAETPTSGWIWAQVFEVNPNTGDAYDWDNPIVQGSLVYPDWQIDLSWEEEKSSSTEQKQYIVQYGAGDDDKGNHNAVAKFTADPVQEKITLSDASPSAQFDITATVADTQMTNPEQGTGSTTTRKTVRVLAPSVDYVGTAENGRELIKNENVTSSKVRVRIVYRGNGGDYTGDYTEDNLWGVTLKGPAGNDIKPDKVDIFEKNGLGQKNAVVEFIVEGITSSCDLTFNNNGTWPINPTETDISDSNGVHYWYAIEEIQDTLEPVSLNDNLAQIISLGQGKSVYMPSASERNLVDTVQLGSGYNAGDAGEKGHYTSDGWHYVWENLPKTDEDGNQLYYYVKEQDAGKDYTTTYDYQYVDDDPTKGISKVTVTNTPPERPKTSVSVQKAWQNEKGEEKTAWLESIQVELLNSSGAHVDVANNPVFLNKDNSWSYTWPDLPEGMYYVRELNTGDTVAYTVTYSNGTTKSENPQGAAVTGGTITITNQSTSVSVDKKWIGKDGKDLTDLTGKKVTVQLYKVNAAGEDEKYDEITLDGTETPTPWHYEWPNLPLGEYYVVETGYEGWEEGKSFTTLYTNGTESTSGSEMDLKVPGNAKVESGNITIKNFEETEIQVEKVWYGITDKTMWNPVTVQLYSSTHEPTQDEPEKQTNVVSTLSLTMRVSDWVDSKKNEADPAQDDKVWMTVQPCDSTGEPIVDEDGNDVVYANSLTSSNNWRQETQELPAVVENEDGTQETKYYLLRFGTTNTSTSSGIQNLRVLNGPNDTNNILVSGAASTTGDIVYNLQATVADPVPGQPKTSNVRNITADAPVEIGSTPAEDNKGLEKISASEKKAYGDPVKLQNGQTLADGYFNDGWGYKWENLPTVNEKGERLYYYVEETGDRTAYTAEYEYYYNTSGEQDSGIKIVRIINTKKKIRITAKKVWDWNEQQPAGADVSKFEVNLALTDENGTSYENKTLKDNSWEVSWDDLEAGHRYTVKEYSVNSGPYMFTCEVTYDWENKKETDLLYHDGTVTVTNTYNPNPYTLPETGGTGTLPYTVGGALLTALATLLLYIQNKRRKEGQGTS